MYVSSTDFVHVMFDLLLVVEITKINFSLYIFVIFSLRFFNVGNIIVRIKRIKNSEKVRD